MLQSAAERE